MAKKERQKRAARKARQKERAEREELLAAQSSQGEPSKKDKKGASATPSKADAAGKADKKKAKKKKKPGRIRTYFQGVKSEMHRVVWPGKAELRNYSIAVIVMLIVFGFCIWVVDTGVLALLAGYAGLRG